jgi:isocitrate/isopropylmalate dehydrogenase
MLNHIHEEEIAERIKLAYNAVLAEGTMLTRDLGGSAGTSEFAEAIIARFGSH